MPPMLGPDQQDVVERARAEPGRELQRSLPVLTRHQVLGRAGDPFFQRIELRFPRSPRSSVVAIS